MQHIKNAFLFTLWAVAALVAVVGTILIILAPFLIWGSWGFLGSVVLFIFGMGLYVSIEDWDDSELY